jgi:cell division transport system permease protein
MATIFYFLSEGARGLFHARLVTFVSIVTIALVLFIALCTGVGMLNVRALFTDAMEKADFVVYVNDSTAADPAALEGLVTAVRLFPQVKKAAIVDKEDSWKRFAALYGQEILTAVEGNPLPVSIEISLKREYLADSSAKELATGLSSIAGVDNVRYAGEWLTFLVRFQRWFYVTALILSVLMLVTFYFTVSNTIKLTVYARKDLIRNMRLVGATRFFIAMPFIIEGMLQGCIGGAIAALAFISLRASPLAALPLSFGPPWVPALPLALGVLFGWIGSSIAVRKFLK